MSRIWLGIRRCGPVGPSVGTTRKVPVCLNRSLFQCKLFHVLNSSLTQRVHLTHTRPLSLSPKPLQLTRG